MSSCHLHFFHFWNKDPLNSTHVCGVCGCSDTAKELLVLILHSVSRNHNLKASSPHQHLETPGHNGLRLFKKCTKIHIKYWKKTKCWLPTGKWPQSKHSKRLLLHLPCIRSFLPAGQVDISILSYINTSDWESKCSVLQQPECFTLIWHDTNVCFSPSFLYAIGRLTNNSIHSLCIFLWSLTPIVWLFDQQKATSFHLGWFAGSWRCCYHLSTCCNVNTSKAT